MQRRLAASLGVVMLGVAGAAQAGPDPGDRSGDLRPAAAAILDLADDRAMVTLGDARAARLVAGPIDARLVRDVGGSARVIYFAPPTTIRVWRRAVDGSTSSCAGRVDTMPFEDYVKGVLPHEWIPSWGAASLQAGAVAIRTYAGYWVNAGGKYTCADLDDTTASQVYKDDRDARASAAVDATAGVFVAKGADLVFAEYSAENGDPTADGVAEPLCTGKAVNGHGRGACQWGTQRWAQSGKPFDWIVTHYYPGATLIGVAPTYAATLTGQGQHATMTSGDELVVEVAYRNDGSATWDAQAVQLGTTGPRDRASPFAKAGAWLAPNRPTAVATATASGATAQLRWTMVAPEVTTATTYTESFALVTGAGQWFGPPDDALTWTITVVPRGDGNGSGSGNPDGGVGGNGAVAGGCAAAGGGAGLGLLIAIGGLAFARRRIRPLRRAIGLR